MFESVVEALFNLFTVERLLFMCIGIAMGLMTGLLPGLGGTAGMAILLPFLFGMDPVAGIAMLVGVVAVNNTSDTFPAVLMGIPGSASSQATIMDGYPLARQGQAGRALTASFLSSMTGGVVGAVCLLGLLLVATPIILALTPPVLFMFILVGLSMVAFLSQKSTLRGLLAGLSGMAIGLVGLAPQSAEYRFSFDMLYLREGIPLAVLALGLFALPELADLVGERRSIARVGREVIDGGRREGLRDVIRNKWLVLRISVLGTAVGILPGVGGSVVDWIAYGATKASVKDSSRFGKGDIRGVIGPESANNAHEGGTMVPTLLFGIPAGGSSAILLGGLLTFGIQPGPSMVTTNLDITLTVIWTLALANLIGGAVCIFLARHVAKLAYLQSTVLAPVLLVLITMAAYQSSRNWGDIIVLFAVGLLGWLMKSSGFPRPPLLIGFVLAVPAERYLHLAMSIHGFAWLLDPLVIGTGALIIFIIFGRPIIAGFQKACRSLLAAKPGAPKS